MKQHRAYGAARIAVLATCALAIAAAAPVQAQTPDELLRNRPFEPTDRALLPHSVYPSTPADAPATGIGWTEAGARAALKGYLQTEYPGNTARKGTELARYMNFFGGVPRLNRDSARDSASTRRTAVASCSPGASHSHRRTGGIG